MDAFRLMKALEQRFPEEDTILLFYVGKIWETNRAAGWHMLRFLERRWPATPPPQEHYPRAA